VFDVDGEDIRSSLARSGHDVDDSLVVVIGATNVGHHDHGEVLSPDGHVIDHDVNHDDDAAVH
jgi:hypothetical protein